MERNLDKTLAEIKLVFIQLNKYMFNGELPEPVFVVQSSRRTKMNAMGWFTFGKIWIDKETGERFNEITICAETLTQPLHRILEVLVHEMVHLYNHTKGIVDCSASQYHNKKFKEAAERCLLKVNEIPHKTYGYAFTEPTQRLKDLLDMVGVDDSAFNVGMAETKPSTKEYSMYSYVCDKCGHKFKTSADLVSAIHNDCGGTFQKQKS